MNFPFNFVHYMLKNEISLKYCDASLHNLGFIKVILSHFLLSLCKH
jgi:hypothetical protein